MDCCHCQKTKHRSDEEQKRLTHRLNRIEGQVRGLKDMLQKDAYCPDILIQVSAVSAALNSFSKELLATHIRTCVADGIRQGDDAVIDELVHTLQKLMKYICKNGFEHHVALVRADVAGIIEEAIDSYLGWNLYVHE